MWADGESPEGALIAGKKSTVVPSRWLTHDFGSPPAFLVAGVGRVNPIFVDELCEAPESPGRSSGYESSGYSEELRWSRELSPIPEGALAATRPSPASTVSSASGLLKVPYLQLYHSFFTRLELGADKGPRLISRQRDISDERNNPVSYGNAALPGDPEVECSVSFSQRRKLLRAPICAQDILLKPSVDSALQEAKCTPQPLDFTLDIPRAERLMRQIEASKRRRCCGRILTAVVALVFFVLTVVIVSLLYTRGKKVFGPL